MKKIISTLIAFAVVISPGALFAEGASPTPVSPSSQVAAQNPQPRSEAQLKKQLLSVKKKQAKTKATLKANKTQVKKVIKKVKKKRVVKKAARKAKKVKTKVIVNPKPTTTTPAPTAR